MQEIAHLTTFVLKIRLKKEGYTKHLSHKWTTFWSQIIFHLIEVGTVDRASI